MAHECIQDVHTCRHLWKEALDKPFDADELAAIHARYRQGLRDNELYSALYTEQRAAYDEERHAAHEAEWERLSPLSKSELFAMTGWQHGYATTTKHDILRSLCDRVVSRIENEHSRVKRLWPAYRARARGEA